MRQPIVMVGIFFLWVAVCSAVGIAIFEVTR